jgi:hypothetical protein
MNKFFYIFLYIKKSKFHYIMNKFFKSFLTFKGDKVNMSTTEIFTYSLIPGVGQLLMRINKFGGSLDKPYLLFPLLLIPPFSFIPVLIAKFGFLKKENGNNIFDIYIIIPIIFRFILIFAMAYFGNDNVILQVALTFIAVLMTNILHIINNKQCKDVNSGNFGSLIFKAIGDSMIQYGSGVLVLFSFSFIPFVGTILEVLRNIPLPIIGKTSKVIDASLWSFGLVMGYMLVNMIDVNYYTKTDICSNKIGMIRIIISVIAFACAIFYSYRDQLIGKLLPI